MIYFNPRHGLGNILFQIATIWTLAKDNGDELCLLGTNRHNDILSAWGRGNLSFLFNRFPQLESVPNDLIINCSNIHYIPLEYKREYQYQGYFPSEKYFKHRRSEILELFKCPDEFNDIINKYSHLFNNISLHVRRGDYVLHSQIFSNLTMEYYINALALLPQDMSVIIFTDDIPWCKQNFIGNRYVFIDEIDYVSLYLMAKMKYHINANSTFSWWGTWLSEDDKAIVPNKWFANDITGFNDKDIYPDSWIKI
jgi:hypothetical protein